jgi:hypothetical protein
MKLKHVDRDGGSITLRVVEETERKKFDQKLKEKHPQRAPQSVGLELRVIAEQGGKPIALLLWTSGCLRLQDRDEWIGWTNAQRAERIKLIVQLRRYLLLHDRGTRPNLASEVLAAGTRLLPILWKERFGFEPLLVESFSDIEAYAGTCYRAAGWQAAGMTKGFAKHRGDLYSFHGRPKKLWLRPLHKQAPQWLRSPRLPERYAVGATANAQGQMPLKPKLMRSLAEALRQTPEPRALNRRYPLGPTLCVIAMALLCGAKDVAQIHRFGWRLRPQQRAALGFRRKKGRAVCQMPGYSVYRNVLTSLDLEAFAEILTQWLTANRGTLPTALAMDGKMIRDTIGILSLVDAQTGVPTAMRIMTQKEGDGQGCEKNVARRLVQSLPDAQGALISGDALHTDKTMAHRAVDNGADYLLQVKGNQPTLKARLAHRTAATPLLPTSRPRDTAAAKPGASVVLTSSPWKLTSPTPAVP